MFCLKFWPIVNGHLCESTCIFFFGGTLKKWCLGKRHFMWSQFWDVSIFIHKVMSIIGLSKTCSNVMSFCKTRIHKSWFHARHFGFVRRVSWSHFLDISGLKTYLCVLDSVCLKWFYFFYFYCLRHVYCQDMSYIWHQDTIFTVHIPTKLFEYLCFWQKVQIQITTRDKEV